MPTVPDINVQDYQNAIPNSLKPQGTEKLGIIIYDKGKVIQQLLTPIAVKLLNEATSTDGLCISQPILEKIILQRNALVTQLNQIGKTLDVITKSITGLSTFFNLVITTIATIDLTAMAASAALKVPPFAAIAPGAITSAINDIQTLIRKLTFTTTGSSRLEKIQKSISSAGISISLVNGYILTIVELLNSLDTILIKCSPNSTFEPISKGIKDSASAQQQAETTTNQTTYNGFIIEIQEVPYTPTVTRRRALGKNQQGIILIQTELSFTTDNLTLINELKLIIDRDNLKAY